MKPKVIINFKTYKYGKDAIKLANIIQKKDKKIIIGVQATDVYPLSKKTKLKVYCEHVDYLSPGRGTGFITPESVKSQGAAGVFLNHSEHPLNLEALKKTIDRCKKVKLKTAVFASSLKFAKKIEKLKPDFLIYEPPELVGGDISVSESKPKLIEEFSKKLKTPFLVGAGIKTKEDITIAMKLGASGIAISSVITQSKNPQKVLNLLLD